MICVTLSFTLSASFSFERFDFGPTGSEVKSVRLPCLLIASIFILYAHAFSDGSNSVR